MHLVLQSFSFTINYYPSAVTTLAVYGITPSLWSILSLGPTKSLLKMVCGFITILTPFFLRVLAGSPCHLFHQSLHIWEHHYVYTVIFLLILFFLVFSCFCAFLFWTDGIAHCGYSHTCTFKASLMVSLFLFCSLLVTQSYQSCA